MTTPVERYVFLGATDAEIWANPDLVALVARTDIDRAVRIVANEASIPEG